MPETPSTDIFQVGVILPGVAGGGHLLVALRRLELTTGPLSRRVSKTTSIVHHGVNIDFYRARLMPPWISTSIVVSDGRQTALATFPSWMRKSLRAALERNGFKVQIINTRIDRGFARVQNVA